MAEYPNIRPYKLTQLNIPMGGGLKYFISDRFNLGLEFLYRKTFTDYIDDVSTTYIGKNNFVLPNGQLSTAGLLQDRSYEVIDPATPLGVEGRQRGWSKQKDQYIIAEIGLSFNISTYRCPGAN